MNAPMRRGACPRLAAPMPTGDGFLARLLLAGTVGLVAMAGLCRSARRHGNGILEITSRGSWQVRGLTASSAALLADDVAVLDIDAVDGVPVVTNPLSGLDPTEAADAGELAATLRAALAAEPFRLDHKIAVVVDGGGTLGLDLLRSDVRLRALADRGAILWHVAVGGAADDSCALGVALPGHAVEVVTRVLRTVAARGPAARAVDLVRSGDDSLRRAVAGLVAAASSPPPRRPVDAIAIHVVRDGRVALGLGLPFGHARAAELECLIDAARAAGASGARTAPGRVLLFVGLASTAAEDLRAAAARLGFVIRRDDPRRFVVACAGAPICGSATMPAREIAAAVAATAAPLLDGSVTIHLSGCRKGCAHPGAATLTLVGTDDGCGLVVGGSARDRPASSVAADAVPAAVGHIAAEVARARRSGETSADVLARTAAAQVAAIVAEARRG